MTSGSSLAPFNAHHLRAALSHSLNTIARHAARLPLPFVWRGRNRPAAGVHVLAVLVLPDDPAIEHPRLRHRDQPDPGPGHAALQDRKARSAEWPPFLGCAPARVWGAYWLAMADRSQ